MTETVVASSRNIQNPSDWNRGSFSWLPVLKFYFIPRNEIGISLSNSPVSTGLGQQVSLPVVLMRHGQSFGPSVISSHECLLGDLVWRRIDLTQAFGLRPVDQNPRGLAIAPIN